MNDKEGHFRSSGTVVDVFVHRFTLDTGDGKILADLGPRASDAMTLRPGSKVIIEGDRKPSEVKVTRIAIDGAEPIDVPGMDSDVEWNSERAKAIAQAEGYAIIGGLSAKKKHFEAKAKKGPKTVDIHIHRDGVREH